VANGNGPPSSLTALAGAVLNFAQDWRRALILVLLGACALLGTIVYQARERVIVAFEELVRPPAGAQLDTAAAPATAATLLHELPGAPRIVFVLAVDVLANAYWLEAAATVPDAAPVLEAKRGMLEAGLPFLSVTRGSNALVIGVLNGHIDCSATSTDPRAHNYLFALGVESVCVAGVPPHVGELVAVILAGYGGPPPDNGDLEITRTLLMHAALTLAGHPPGG